MKSPYKSEGMYLLIDIGSTTFDVSTFSYYAPNGDEQYPIWTAEVERLGIMALHQHRIKKIKEICSKNRMNPGVCIPEFDGISSLPPINNYLNFPINDDFQNIDKEFLEECSRCIREILKETKDKRNPNAPEWTTVFPVFLCGGGSLMQEYRDLPDEIAGKLINAGYCLNFSLKTIPMPDEIGGSTNNKHRMAVAYGLSFPKIEIGTVKDPTAIKDLILPPKKKDLDSYFISAEMV